MKILLTHSYFLRFDPKQWAAGQPYAPLATLYAAAVLRAHGHEVTLFDSMYATGPEEVYPFVTNNQPDIVVICDDGFNYLTKMCLTNMREAAFRMMAIVKNQGCTVIVSSSDATDHCGEYHDKGADYIVIGEAEQTLLELCNAISGNAADIPGIAGISFKKGEEYVRTLRRQLIQDLDELPFPAWDLADMTKYRDSWMNSTGYFSMNVVTTRGCPFKCNWCAKPIYGNRYHARSPENVVRELAFLQGMFGFDHIWFCDDIFGLKPGWIAEFSRLVNEKQLNFRFKIQSRADLLLTEDNIRALASAGCDNVWIGAESGSQKILDAMDKGITTSQIADATHYLKSAGIKPSFFIQFGYPGENMEDISKTIGMINKLLPYSIGVSVSYPLPGTPFYERVKSELREKANWTDSDELVLMFKNTYPPAFYKLLHRYVQKNHRLRLAIARIHELWKSRQFLSVHTVRKLLSIIYYSPQVAIAKVKLNTLENQFDHEQNTAV